MYRWDPRTDKVKSVNRSKHFMKKLKMFTRMTDAQIKKDLKQRETILKWLVKHNITNIVSISEVVSRYNRDPKELLKLLKKKNYHLVLSK